MSRPRGEGHYNSKLDSEDVRLIRSAVDHRRELLRDARLLSDIELAKKFGVSRSCISRIAQGVMWRHLL